jgi:hypothetical protein
MWEWGGSHTSGPGTPATPSSQQRYLHVLVCQHNKPLRALSVWPLPEFCAVQWDQVHSVRRPLIGWHLVVDYDDCEQRIGRGNRSTRRAPAPMLLISPRIPRNSTWDRSRAAAVRIQLLTSWPMARRSPLKPRISEDP